MNPKKLIYIKQSELKDLRKKYYDEQDGICPILKIKIPFEDCVLDHRHLTKNETLGEDGAGCLRGVIHRGANSAEGTILSIYKRRGLMKLVSYNDFLTGLTEFINNPPLFDMAIIHPSEKPKLKRLGKRQYNKVIKYWKQMYPKRKEPDFPKSGKVTKAWEEYIKLADNIHYIKYKNE